jgi:hypothetical protein
MKSEPTDIDEMGKFIAQHHWQAFATLTFKVAVSLEEALAATTSWLRGLGASVYAYLAPERGDFRGRAHCHVLIGGMYRGDGKKAGLDLKHVALRHAERMWKQEAANGHEPHGGIVIEDYEPSRGAAWYVSKLPADGQIIGTMQRHHGHRSRRKRNRALIPSHEETRKCLT